MLSRFFARRTVRRVLGPRLADLFGLSVANIIHAAENNDRHTVRRFIKSRWDQPYSYNLYAKIISGEALHVAAGAGHRDIVNALCHAGVDANHVQYQGAIHGGRAPLIVAAEKGDVELINMLVTNGADINFREERNDCGFTPLMAAVERGHLAAVKALLEQGADVDKADRYGWSPLMAAVSGRDRKKRLLKAVGESVPKREKNKQDLVELLLKYGANATLMDEKGNSILMLAVMSHSDPDILFSLVNAGASMYKQNLSGESPANLLTSLGKETLVSELCYAQYDARSPIKPDRQYLPKTLFSGSHVVSYGLTGNTDGSSLSRLANHSFSTRRG